MTIEISLNKEHSRCCVIAVENGKEINLEDLSESEMKRITLGELYRLMEKDI